MSYKVWVETEKLDRRTDRYERDCEPEPLDGGEEFGTEKQAIRAKLLAVELYDLRSLIFTVCRAVLENVINGDGTLEAADLLQVLKNGGVK